MCWTEEAEVLPDQERNEENTIALAGLQKNDDAIWAHINKTKQQG